MRREIYPEELSYFYQKIGEAIWHLQIVEDFLVKLYMVKALIVSPRSMTEEDAQDELSKLEKKTLGQLIGLFEKGQWVSEEFIARLKNFNSIRKWMVHNSGRQSGESLYTDHGREYFISKICEFTDLAVEFQQEIQNFFIEYGRSQNIPVDQVFDDAKINLEKLKGNV